MNSKKFRLILMATFGMTVLIFIIIWSAGLSAMKKQSDKMVDLKLKNQTADAQLANLESSKNEIKKYSYFKDVARSVIPSDKDQAQAVLDILNLASQSGFSIQSINFPTSNLGSKNAASASKNALISQAQAVSGIPGLYSVQLTITPATGAQIPPDRQVTYAKMLNFLQRIENNRRTAQIAQVNIQPLTEGGQINFTLILNVFIKP
jgi:hypothetical protein